MNDDNDPKLDDLLRQAFPGAVADDGFSTRVMRALPRRRQRTWLLPAAAVTGGVLTWLSLLPSPLLQQLAIEWSTGSHGAAAIAVGTVLLGIALLGCGWALDEQ